MLVLSRKTDECIVINQNIRIRVISIRGDRVRIGIEAPREVAVHREEVLHSIHQESLKSDEFRTEEIVESTLN